MVVFRPHVPDRNLKEKSTSVHTQVTAVSARISRSE